ncbi:hypothetical protein O179_03575 [Chlamydia trachomatis]|nr:hypothetical protein E150_03445 [Chlamydia trachomatis E/150]ADH21133.1 hypothetical protein E11023_03425 [Chlamydia trachomatis E/11023]AGR94088.1 hypothetical protein CTRC69_03455 [Chlamydia trachomatis RC-F/69]AGR95934.1 hypothetical protein CTRC852_03490 [Chlamydia trachomatis RC-F(s)/852]AGR99653.1 hypothetical protein CTRC342_03480 [Chlamydia trachomatis RC-F(s)/342]AGT64901.1 hypothetical protein O169_03580 [Chlamydia trachomatis]AGT67684.1 hypothetical protein O173_03575 [Chlamydia
MYTPLLRCLEDSTLRGCHLRPLIFRGVSLQYLKDNSQVLEFQKNYTLFLSGIEVSLYS